MEVDPVELASLPRAYVIAAAGCGKTELIADAAGATKGRSLVLTHTHAGVGALRSRLARKQIPRGQCSVETLDGFALRFAASYPLTSGWDKAQPTGGDWPLVRVAAARWLRTSAAEQVLTASYDGVYVDEYQDCTSGQHELVDLLADILPTRLLGDPLQGIFGWAGQPLDWDLVYNRFDNAGVLETPHRWASSNPPLGEWLVDARHKLLAGQEPDWSTPVVHTRTWSEAEEIASCQRLAGEESVVAIRKYPSDEYKVASKLGGRFVSMEPIAARALFQAVADLEGAEGRLLALATIDVAATCMTGVREKLRSAWDRLALDEEPTARPGSPVEAAVLSLRAVKRDGIVRVAEALEAIQAIEGVRTHRAELFEEIRRAVRSRADGSTRPLTDVAWDLRENTRRQGRVVPPRIVSRTLLVKGLEFDHAVVLRRNELDSNDLYVAMTRPKHSLTVLR